MSATEHHVLVNAICLFLIKQIHMFFQITEMSNAAEKLLKTNTIIFFSTTRKLFCQWTEIIPLLSKADKA